MSSILPPPDRRSPYLSTDAVAWWPMMYAISCRDKPLDLSSEQRAYLSCIGWVRLPAWPESPANAHKAALDLMHDADGCTIDAFFGC
jgi:hypothetical protein